MGAKETSARSFGVLLCMSSVLWTEKAVRREPISKSCEITQADNLNRRRRLSSKAQCLKNRGRDVIKIFLV